MVEKSNFESSFAAIKERRIRYACRRKRMLLRVRRNLRPDYTTNQTCTEVYILTKSEGNGIHFFSIEESGVETPETMVVENRNLTDEKLQDQIRQFLQRHYSQLGGVKINFIKPSRTQES